MSLLLKIIFLPIYLPFTILRLIGLIDFCNDAMNYFDEH